MRRDKKTSTRPRPRAGAHGPLQLRIRGLTLGKGLTSNQRRPMGKSPQIASCAMRQGQGCMALYRDSKCQQPRKEGRAGKGAAMCSRQSGWRTEEGKGFRRQELVRHEGAASCATSCLEHANVGESCIGPMARNISTVAPSETRQARGRPDAF